jgi:hypothetical protein
LTFARDILAKINGEVDTTTIQVLFTPQVPALQGHHNYTMAIALGILLFFFVPKGLALYI